jgi:Tfp pilus assembly protein PilO
VIEKILNRTQPGFIYGGMIAAIVLVVLGAYLYLFKDAWAEYRLLQTTRTTLNETVASGTELSSAILRSQQQVDALVKRLQGESPRLPVNQMIARTLDRLDRIAAQHDIQLISVNPETSKSIASFAELPFSIEVKGNYQRLTNWLGATEKELDPMMVKELEIIPVTGKDELTMRLELVSYRLPELAI